MAILSLMRDPVESQQCSLTDNHRRCMRREPVLIIRGTGYRRLELVAQPGIGPVKAADLLRVRLSGFTADELERLSPQGRQMVGLFLR